MEELRFSLEDERGEHGEFFHTFVLKWHVTCPLILELGKLYFCCGGQLGWGNAMNGVALLPCLSRADSDVARQRGTDSWQGVQ
jgi:hypothetical protein